MIRSNVLRGGTIATVRRHIVSALAVLAIFLLPTAASSDIVITLKNGFIEKYKNRATIEATYTVDKAHPHPNPASKDGDIHIAGRAPEIGLPCVAEIMNAAAEPEAVQKIHAVEGTGQTVKVTGAWRLWCEHGGDSEQIQGADLQPFDTTNPPHVFEIHPITAVDDRAVLDSFHPIDGYTPKLAGDAFMSYENRGSSITTDDAKKTTTIVTGMGGYNYVEFVMKLAEDPRAIPDGQSVMASVLDLEGELLVHNRRMIFVKDSPPEVRLRNLHRGDKLHVLGVPRIDLALVSWRVAHAASRPGVLNWNLPYEILVVGVYDESGGNE